MTLNMFPACAFADAPDRFRIDAELITDLFVAQSARPQFSDRWNVGFGQLATRTQATARVMLSTFRDHVMHVISTGARAEVCRINAGRIVTRMHQDLARRYRAAVDQVRRPMGLYAPMPPIEDSIAVFVGGSGPQPTRIRLLHIFQKAWQGRAGVLIFKVARARTVLPVPGLDLVCSWVKGARAGGAAACYFLFSHLISPKQKLWWSGSLERSHSPAGRFYFITV